MTAPDLYLILHKVRGEPAFDIAERIQIGSEEGWIIPTSGHRAYPHQWWSMRNVWIGRTIDAASFVPALIELPETLPDHYPVLPKKQPPPAIQGKLDKIRTTVADIEELFK